MPSIFAGLCNGAKSPQSFISCNILLFIITESENFSHQCTILCHIASIFFIFDVTCFMASL